MTSTKPYLIRAINEWAIENSLTPQILVSSEVEGVVVPQDYVKDGHIVFNIHYNAVSQLSLTNEQITFSARFSGQAMNVEVPIDAVLAIYARENGQGIFFQNDEKTPSPDDDKTATAATEKTADADTKSGKSHLKLVK